MMKGYKVLIIAGVITGYGVLAWILYQHKNLQKALEVPPGTIPVYVPDPIVYTTDPELTTSGRRITHGRYGTITYWDSKIKAKQGALRYIKEHGGTYQWMGASKGYCVFQNELEVARFGIRTPTAPADVVEAVEHEERTKVQCKILAIKKARAIGGSYKWEGRSKGYVVYDQQNKVVVNYKEI